MGVLIVKILNIFKFHAGLLGSDIDKVFRVGIVLPVSFARVFGSGFKLVTIILNKTIYMLDFLNDVSENFIFCTIKSFCEYFGLIIFKDGLLVFLKMVVDLTFCLETLDNETVLRLK